MNTKITTDQLQTLSKNIAMLSADAVQQANSGHPGMPMGAADMASVLWAKHLRFNPEDPNWLGRDRFVLSAGHGSMLLYSLLHLFGFPLSLDEIKNFRQWDSLTPGHPEYGHTVGVETTTGPLGQGFANGVGMALGSKLLAAHRKQDLLGYRVFGIVSDGDLMEGISTEAASLAGHLKLGNLTYLYDDNDISIGGSTDICFTEDVPAKFQALGWHVQSVDGHDLDQIDAALTQATQSDKPSIICARTFIGKGSPSKENSADSHGAPLGDEELEKTKKNLGWPTVERFVVLDEVKSVCASIVEDKKAEHASWNSEFSKWDGASLLSSEQFKKDIQAASSALRESFVTNPDTAKGATRGFSGEVLQVLSAHLPGLIGGSADLEPSNKTLIKASGDITANDFSAKNIRFGVREHTMGAIANGLAYGGSGWTPYTATFLVFADYMRPSIRLAALSKLNSLFIFTHDSFWVGEDGPTHQPIEHIASLRVIPNLYLFRPADKVETALCYEAAIKREDGPSTLLFTRQNVEAIARDDSFSPEDVLKGGYVVHNPEGASITLVATGSEVGLALSSACKLAGQGVQARVVSMPCVELFNLQSSEYRSSIIPPAMPTVSIEAGSTMGWKEIVGANGLTIGIDHYGASAPGEVLAEKFGFTPESVTARITAWLQ